MFGAGVVLVLCGLGAVCGDVVTLPTTWPTMPHPTTIIPFSTRPDVIYKYSDTYGKPYTPGGLIRDLHNRASGTCWARGGVCMSLRHCQMTAANLHTLVPDCDYRRLICCLINRHGSPTVGLLRSSQLMEADLQDLDEDLMSVAGANSDLMQGLA